MNVLILAAGYATRLYPLTLNKAKPLLEVAGKPIIEWVMDNLEKIPDLETIYIVTNEKFAADFHAWADAYRDRHPHFKFKIINDGSTSDNDKLGAIGDINLALTREGDILHSGLIVVFSVSAGLSVLAALASLMRGKRQVPGEPAAVADPAAAPGLPADAPQSSRERSS